VQWQFLVRCFGGWAFFFFFFFLLPAVHSVPLVGFPQYCPMESLFLRNLATVLQQSRKVILALFPPHSSHAAAVLSVASQILKYYPCLLTASRISISVPILICVHTLFGLTFWSFASLPGPRQWTWDLFRVHLPAKFCWFMKYYLFYFPPTLLFVYSTVFSFPVFIIFFLTSFYIILFFSLVAEYYVCDPLCISVVICSKLLKKPK